jgi:hypothetical protein
LAKTTPTCQTNSPQAQITDSSSKNAVNFSSGTRNETLSVFAMAASAIQIVRPSQSTAETWPKLHNGFAEILRSVTDCC